MAFIAFQYWPYLVAAMLAGIAVGWWCQDPGSLRPRGKDRGPR
jgi:hypothetical protein